MCPLRLKLEILVLNLSSCGLSKLHVIFNKDMTNLQVSVFCFNKGLCNKVFLERWWRVNFPKTVHKPPNSRNSVDISSHYVNLLTWRWDLTVNWPCFFDSRELFLKDSQFVRWGLFVAADHEISFIILFCDSNPRGPYSGSRPWVTWTESYKGMLSYNSMTNRHRTSSHTVHELHLNSGLFCQDTLCFDS